MDDTISDPGTFVSIENFMTSPAQSLDPLAASSESSSHANPDPRDAPREGTEGNGEDLAITSEHQASFMWGMFTSDRDYREHSNTHTPVEENLSVYNSVTSDSRESTENQDEELTDVSDLCINFDDCTAHDEEKGVSITSTPRTDHEKSRELPGRESVTLHAANRGNTAGQVSSQIENSDNRSSTSDSADNGNTIPPAMITRDLTGGLRRTGWPQESTDVFSGHLQSWDGEHFEVATEGLTTFETKNPFVTDATTNEDNIVLFTKTGPFSAEEVIAFQRLAADSRAPEYRVVSKLVETVWFLHCQIVNLKGVAEEINGKDLSSERRRFSEVGRQDSYTIKSLINELDDEKKHSTAISHENSALKNKLRIAEHKVQEVDDYCRKFDSNISVADGIEAALNSIFVHAKESRRLSTERLAIQNQQLDEYGNRALQLGSLFEEHRKRLEAVEAENVALRRHVSVLEGTAPSEGSHSPEIPLQQGNTSFAVAEERDELARKVKSQTLLLETLTTDYERMQAAKKDVDDAILALNIDVQSARHNVAILQQQRDEAESALRQVEHGSLAEKNRYIEMSRELSDNIVEAVHDLDHKDSEIQRLQKDVEDRESVIQSLQTGISEREEQLSALTNAAIEEKLAESDNGSVVQSELSRLVGTVVKNLRFDLAKAQSLLAERSDEVFALREKAVSSDELVYTLRRKCDRFCAVANAKSNTIHFSAGPDMESYLQKEQQNSFLRRLSEKLGCTPTSSTDLVTTLISQVDQLLSERSMWENSAVDCRRSAAEAEQNLHTVRTEMFAEISLLKADVQHLENVNSRTRAECEILEKNLMQVLGNRDLTNCDSIGDFTTSSFGSRRQTGESGDRRDSILSRTVDVEGTLRWNDPLVIAAIQSLDDLIEMKNTLAARYRALHERLDRIFRRGDTTGISTNDARTLVIESRELQEDLSGIVNMQQDVIHRLRQSHDADGTIQEANADETLSYIQDRSIMNSGDSVLSVTGRDADQATLDAFTHLQKHRRVSTQSEGMGEAAEFLRNQLQRTRVLYNEKSRANAQLCLVVTELRHDLKQAWDDKKSLEELLSQVSDDHDKFIGRLCELAQVEPSTTAIEDFLRLQIMEVSRQSREMYASHMSCVRAKSTNVLLTVQRNFYAHLIDMYRTNYAMDILALVPDPQVSLARRRFRVSISAVIAVLRFSKFWASKTDDSEELDISDFNMPDFIPLTPRFAESIPMVNVTVAVAAIPRLEAAVVKRDREIIVLKKSLDVLDNVASAAQPNLERDMPVSSFVYNEDLLDRKQDQTRRLRKALKEKADVEVRFMQEKESRLAAEAKLVRYSEKLSIAKKRLGKEKSQTEARERTYKAAIKYLKKKTIKALEDDVYFDENVDPEMRPQEELSSKRTQVESMTGSKKTGGNSLTILQEQIKHAEKELEQAPAESAGAQQLSHYVRGLHQAVRHLEGAKSSTAQGSSVLNSNIAG